MPRLNKTLSAQRFENGEVHDWYRFVWGFSDHLVAGLLEEWDLPKASNLLDPFCGTGTTLVECLKRGHSPTGIDASPASLFAARVKTRWSLTATRALRALDSVLAAENKLPRDLAAYRNDPTYQYLDSSGMIERGWISPRPLQRCLALKTAIKRSVAETAYRDFLMLALLDTVVQAASNVRFGPELYVGRTRADASVIDEFASRALTMASDLTILRRTDARAAVVRGDSRTSAAFASVPGKFVGVICSPPYPTEHDYTRNARLELAFLEAVSDVNSVRSIKKRMIRSHTKGVYARDRDWRLAWTHPVLNKVLIEIEENVADRGHGFARLYSTVVASYFGGMYRHFRSVRPALARRALCAYVVSDQAGYANVPIPTATILADLASAVGFSVVDVRHWRDRQSTTTGRVIKEEILILKAHN